MKKKLVSVMLAGAMALCLAGCGGGSSTGSSDSSSSSSGSSFGDLLNNAISSAVDEAVGEINSEIQDVSDQIGDAVGDVNDGLAQIGSQAKSEGVMTYAEYAAADLDTYVTIETYVQAHQSWWDGKITVYTQDADGAYFLYELPCTEEEAAKLVPGTKIGVQGYKSEWSGEVEITDSSFEFIEDGDTFVASPVDLTDLLASDELINYQNQLFCANGLTVVARDSGNAVDYKWDNSGSHDENSDLYFNVQDAAGNVYTFTVESYLTGNDTDVYAAVEGLNVGDVVDVEGFLYWYEGVNPHITGIGVR